MTAGRELDALVAEKVFGYKYPVGLIGYVFNLITPAQIRNQVVPPYSTSIAAAWEVIEKMSEQYDWRLTLEEDLRDYEPEIKYLCTLYRRNKNDAVAVPVGEAYAPTMPLAICLAALKAVGVST